MLPTKTPGAVELVPLDESKRTTEILKMRQPVAICEVKSTFRKLNEFPDEDILPVCKQYLQCLETVVSEGEMQFAL